MRNAQWMRRGAVASGLVLLTGTMFGTAQSQVGAPGQNAFGDGNFESVQAGALPQSWSPMNAERLAVVSAAGNKWLRITNNNLADAAAFTRNVPLPAGSKLVQVSARMKTSDIKLGNEGWHEPRIVLRFTNDKGDQVGGYPAIPNMRFNSDWMTREVILEVPEGATQLQMQPGLWLSSGVLEIDDIRVVPYASAADFYNARAVAFRTDFPEGTFAQADNSGVPVGWTVPGPQFQVATVDGSKVLRINNNVPDADLAGTTVVKTDPKWAAVNIKMQARATDFQPGSYGWKQGRVVVQTLDENGKQIGENTVASIDGNADWREYSTTLSMPENARYLRLQAGFERAAGTLELRNVALVPEAEAAPRNAELPANQQLNWGQETVTQTSATRGTMSLNGLWRFIPAEGAAARDPQAGWGYIKVPGSWKRNEDIVARGTGRMWQNYNGDRLAAAWYERDITIPANWQGRAVLLELRRVSTDATVFVDGKEASTLNWPGGFADITNLVKAGQTHKLRIRVVATDDRTQVTHYMGYLFEATSPANLDNRGIIGQVNLLSRPQGVYVNDLLVRPSTRQKKLNVDIELNGVQQAGNVEFTARLLDEKGALEKTFTQSIPVRAGAAQTVTASWEWADPRLWDYQQPNLYTLQLGVKGAGFNDEYSQQFGFREFWIEGNQFYLNNSLFRIRPGNIQYGARPSQMMEQGFNLGEIWPENRARRGSNHNDDEIMAEADHTGLPVSGNLLHMADFIGIDKWVKPETRADFQRQMELEVRRRRNHPSVVMWTTTGNALGIAWGDSDPWTIGLPPTFVQENVNQRQRVREAFAMVKAIDPTRPIYGHHSDNGDVHTSNMYLNFIPLQEREEWLSHWAQNKSLPWMGVEFGPPLYSTLMRGRDGYTHQGHSEPHLTEWTARYLGREAYALEPEQYRTLVLRDRYKGTNPQQEYDPHIRNDGRERIIADSPAFTKLLDLYYTNTYRSWRTMGMSGGIVPWHHDRHPALRRVNGPSLAWIAGAGGRPDQSNADKPVWTEKDKSFRPGQKIDKQIVLINDFRSPQEYSYSWQANVAGKKIAGATKSGRLPVGEITFVPISFNAPSAFTGEKASGEIRLTAKIGTQAHSDVLPFHVFKPAPRVRGAIAVFDPVGETTALLKSLGYNVQLWKGGAVPGGTLVIGRKVLSNKNAVPAGVQQFVQNGGRLVVMAQEPRWMEYALGLRTAPHVARRVYRIDNAHPVVSGLNDFDLQDWNGTSKLTQAYPRYTGYDWAPAFGWKWGNRHGVSSAPVEKPHRTSWRPILETEFDLAYSPLMEMEFGRGRITLSTLDLEDHVTVDPAANKLARQLFEYVRTAPLAPKANRVLYIGDAAGARVLDDLGVNYTRATTIDTAAQLVVVGNASNISETDVRRFATNGGKVLVLPHNGSALGAQITQAKDFHGSLAVPNWPEARGLSASDLNIKGLFDAWLVTGGNGIEIGADGMVARQKAGTGMIVWSQMGPHVLPADQTRYYRFSRWRQTRALSQLLSNLGASFKQDVRSVEMLQQPPHAWMLSGTWDAQLTTERKESPTRQWNGDPGISERAKSLVALNAPATGWNKVTLPGYMESFGPKWRFIDGEVVYRKEIDVPAHMAGNDLFIALGRVDETEETFFNGQSVGKSRNWMFGRGHRIPGNLVKAGRNVLAVRTWDEGIHGGMMGDPHYFSLRPADLNTNFYHDDYVGDDIDESKDEKGWGTRHERWKIADNPYRYYRW